MAYGQEKMRPHFLQEKEWGFVFEIKFSKAFKDTRDQGGEKESPVDQ
jgi:hypothetical protein